MAQKSKKKQASENFTPNPLPQHKTKVQKRRKKRGPP